MVQSKNKPMYFEVKAENTTAKTGIIRVVGLNDRAIITIGHEQAMIDTEHIDALIMRLVKLRKFQMAGGSSGEQQS